jgi:hypothetical protein
VKTANGFASPAQVLLYGSGRTPLVRAVPDGVYLGMWRLVWPDGRTSGLANIDRIRDAGIAICAHGPPTRDSRCLHWEESRESPSRPRGRIFGDRAAPSPSREIARASGDLVTDPIVLAERTGLTLDQIALGTALMRSGRVDLINKVIAGEMTAGAALTTAKRERVA